MAITTHSCADFVKELRWRTRDYHQLHWSEDRYQGAVNQAIRESPRPLWQVDIDTSIVTVDDTRRYALAALTTVTEANQVQRIWLEGSDDHYYPLARWHVEDDAGTLTLVIHEDPPDEDLTIRIEYVEPWTALDCSGSGTTDLDPDWLIAKAMTILLLEADPTLMDAAWLDRQLGVWDAKRMQVEREQGRRRPASKAKTQAW